MGDVPLQLVDINGDSMDVILQGELHVPGYVSNLLPMDRAADRGVLFTFLKDVAKLELNNGYLVNLCRDGHLSFFPFGEICCGVLSD